MVAAQWSKCITSFSFSTINRVQPTVPTYHCSDIPVFRQFCPDISKNNPDIPTCRNTGFVGIPGCPLFRQCGSKWVVGISGQNKIPIFRQKEEISHKFDSQKQTDQNTTYSRESGMYSCCKNFPFENVWKKR